MTAEIINGFVGLVVGLLSGYVFERRATMAAKAYSRELERELAEIRHSVLSVGGFVGEPATPSTDSNLLSLLRSRAQAIQDSEGRVAKSSLTTHFLAKGHSGEDIDQAIRQLCSSGEAKEVDNWLMLR